MKLDLPKLFDYFISFFWVLVLYCCRIEENINFFKFLEYKVKNITAYFYHKILQLYLYFN